MNNKLNSDLPAAVSVIPAVGEILQRLEGAGFEAYAVGGCVRDLLLGRAVNDWDLCSAASPEEVAALFHDCRCIPTGLEHGTVTLLYEGVPYEITMFRLEEDYDGRRPGTVRPARTIQEDLRRRDFTINAMAYSPGRGLIDLYGGQEDLKRGLLRAVGEPMERFREDYLRILRGLRFASQLGLSIEEETAAAMLDCAGGLRLLSGERVWQELKKLLPGPHAGEVLRRFSPILSHLSPCWRGFDFPPERGERLDRLPAKLPLRLAFLLEGLGEGRTAALEELRCTSLLKKQVGLLWEQTCLLLTQEGQALECLPHQEWSHPQEWWHPQEWLRKFPKDFRAEGAEAALWLCGKEELLPQVLSVLDGQPLDLSDLAISGKELLELGLRGKEVGAALERLLRLVWSGDCGNEREELLSCLLNFVKRN